MQILDEGIEAFADLLMADLHVADLHVADLHVAEPPTDDAGEGAPDPWSAVAAGDDPERTAGLVLALAAVNFGSGWHPVLRKRPGCSGATTVALGMVEWLGDATGPDPERLARADPGRLADRLGQPTDDPDVGGLVAHFAAALVEIGTWVQSRHGGSWVAFVESGGGTAGGVAERLAELPHFADTADYDGHPVALYKRAQLAAADLWRGFGGAPPAAFPDVGRLTAFADNLVPHVLRLEGVLAYDERLSARIESGALLDAGSQPEVEIRACGVHAVELLAAALGARGRAVTPAELDARLWRRGGRYRYKAVPRHRTRTTAY